MTEETWEARFFRSMADCYKDAPAPLAVPSYPDNVWADIEDVCESPIECLMCAALLWIAWKRFDYYDIDGAAIRVVGPAGSSLDVSVDSEGAPDNARPKTLTKISLQRDLADWRVDFLVQVGCHVPDFGKPIPINPPGRYRFGDKIEVRNVIVECDGHDFHERTKEQAAKDRSRDRRMQAEGYKVFRFTGAEIWADAVGCAREVFDLFGDDD
jgi:hypothetical protein